MYQKKKEKLYIIDIISDPAVAYPAYYMLSHGMAKNEMLHEALIALHQYDWTHYETPANHESIFSCLRRGSFPIYREKYAVGYFGGKMMYLESHGWKRMPLTEEVFVLDNWLVC